MRLVIDTAFGLSVALLDGDAVVAGHDAPGGRGHAEAVVAAVAAVVGTRGGEVRDILVDVGPGSFTGLRIGVAAARALGLAWNVPVSGYGSLALIAAGASGAVTAVADAGRGQVYWQAFDGAGRPRGDAAAADAARLILPPGTVVAGSGAARVAGDYAVVAGGHRARDARLLRADACALPPVPLYLRAAVAA